MSACLLSCLFLSFKKRIMSTCWPVRHSLLLVSSRPRSSSLTSLKMMIGCWQGLLWKKNSVEKVWMICYSRMQNISPHCFHSWMRGGQYLMVTLKYWEKVKRYELNVSSFWVTLRVGFVVAAGSRVKKYPTSQLPHQDNGRNQKLYEMENIDIWDDDDLNRFLNAHT